MREKGFLERSGMRAADLVTSGLSGELCSIEAARAGRGRRPADAGTRLLTDLDHARRRLVGALNETHLYDALVRQPDVKTQPVEAIMQPVFPFVDISTNVELLSTMITHDNPAVLVRDFKTDKTFIITRSDLIRVLV